MFETEVSKYCLSFDRNGSWFSGWKRAYSGCTEQFGAWQHNKQSTCHRSTERSQSTNSWGEFIFFSPNYTDGWLFIWPEHWAVWNVCNMLPFPLNFGITWIVIIRSVQNMSSRTKCYKLKLCNSWILVYVRMPWWNREINC